MKPFPHRLAAVLAALACASSGHGADALARFYNGDEIAGRLAGADDETVLWKSPALSGAQRLFTRELQEIELPYSPPVTQPDSNHLATLTLTNGDELRGVLEAVTDESLTIRTTYAGELTLRRDMVEGLRISKPSQTIYAGPRSLEDWVSPAKDRWRFESGALVCNGRGSIGRELGRHPQMRIRFVVSWEHNTRFQLYLHADSEDPETMRHGYELVCQRQYTYLRKQAPGENSTVGSVAGIREFNSREPMEFELLHDLESGRLRFKIDGKVIKDWQEANPTPDLMGTYLHFGTQQGTETRISRIVISSWDGSLETPWGAEDGNRQIRLLGRGGMDPDEAELTEEETPPETGIELRNGDRVSGEVVAIADRVVTLETDFGEFQLPVARLRRFALRTPEEAADPELCWKPLRQRGDVRAWFPGGGHITFKLLGLEEGKLIGASQTFGEAGFDLGAFSRIEFNLYRPTATSG